jgi:hypothetical protein
VAGTEHDLDFENTEGMQTVASDAAGLQAANFKLPLWQVEVLQSGRPSPQMPQDILRPKYGVCVV